MSRYQSIVNDKSLVHSASVLLTTYTVSQKIKTRVLIITGAYIDVHRFSKFFHCQATGLYSPVYSCVCPKP